MMLMTTPASNPPRSTRLRLIFPIRLQLATMILRIAQQRKGLRLWGRLGFGAIGGHFLTEPPHAAQPAIIVRRLALEVIADLGMGKNQEAFVVQALDHG